MKINVGGRRRSVRKLIRVFGVDHRTLFLHQVLMLRNSQHVLEGRDVFYPSVVYPSRNLYHFTPFIRGFFFYAFFFASARRNARLFTDVLLYDLFFFLCVLLAIVYPRSCKTFTDDSFFDIISHDGRFVASVIFFRVRSRLD